MRRTSRAIPLLTLAVASAVASAKPVAPLLVGDDAPALRVGAWLAGAPVENLDRGRVYVVEPWGTWNAACKITLPALADLARRHADVRCVAVGVNEADAGQTRAFVRSLGEATAGLGIAIDDASPPPTPRPTAPGQQPEEDDRVIGSTARDWWRSTGGESSPVAFIVNADGVVAWIGRPMRAEPALKAILAGTYDLAAARRASIDATAAREELATASAEFVAAMSDPAVAHDAASSVAIVDRLIAKYPAAKATFSLSKFFAQVQLQRYDEAYATADEACEAAATQGKPMLINELAWFIVDNAACGRRDLARAMRYAQLAVDASDGTSGAILDTLARAQFLNGEFKDAAENEAKAASICDDADREQVDRCLAEYRATAATRPTR